MARPLRLRRPHCAGCGAELPPRWPRVRRRRYCKRCAASAKARDDEGRQLCARLALDVGPETPAGRILYRMAIDD